MTRQPSLSITNATLPDGTVATVVVRDGLIHDVIVGPTPTPPPTDVAIDATGLLLMPGAIDMHVHMREPGLTHKADMASETLAAIAGGVTSVADMPNTIPQTTTEEALEEKRRIAARTARANYTFFIGATADNIDTLPSLDYHTIPGVKAFMGSSTGGMLIDDDATLQRLFATVRKPIVVHAEDQRTIERNTAQALEQYGDRPIPIEMHAAIRSVEACVRATRRAIDLAKRYDARLHIAHLSTAAEAALLSTDALSQKRITAEVSPHHLWFTSDDYSRLGARIKMNPSVKAPEHREALRRAVLTGQIDTIATDHAPHLIADKQGDALHATSGAPMVQYSVPLMLELFAPHIVAQKMASAPAALFGIERRGRIAPGYYADLCLFSTDTPYTISDSDVLSKCGWTPLVGTTLRHKAVTTLVNGVVVYDARWTRDQLLGAPRAAMPLTFG